MRTTTTATGWKIEAIMRALGITVADLARTAGTTRQNVYYLIRHVERLRPKTRGQLIETLKANITAERFTAEEGVET